MSTPGALVWLVTVWEPAADFHQGRGAMLVNRLTKIAAITLLALTVNGCASTSALNMMDALGGTQGVTKLAGTFLQSASSNGTLGSLLHGKDLSALTPKVSDQLCSLMGGGCQ